MIFEKVIFCLLPKTTSLQQIVIQLEINGWTLIIPDTTLKSQSVLLCTHLIVCPLQKALAYTHDVVLDFATKLSKLI